MSVCVESVEDVVYFDVDLQILQDNSDYPFDFLCRAYRKQLSKCVHVVLRRPNQFIEKGI